ncbi:MAG TPA: tRNA (N6-isopentenyl adenosine(37)-C2)-methylthiotransferase MiaB [Candidatus Binataceae bacterium]|nr:tRNA (N6-isopentenyl adenosine(37)-C2)-methylthiotransferase MiaB [Candidatus Binataceae bacterium]
MDHAPIDNAGWTPRFYLETYGCQMNVADSQLIGGQLRRAGYISVDAPEQADVILLNTCAIREHAEERVLSRLSELARLKERQPALRLGLVGCMAQNNRAALLSKAPYLDLVAGPDAYRQLPRMLADAGFDPVVDVRLDRNETYADLDPDWESGVRAYVTIMRGCDRFCAFCVVPYVRGRERSVPIAALMAQLRVLARRGVREVVLLGQTVNAYRDEAVDFAALLHAAAGVEGIERIRFTSPHPCDMSPAVIEAMASEAKVQPYLHLPVQSGSDRMLAAMGRGYGVQEYLALVARLRAAIPDLALSTDLIVGFCEESAEDFDATLELMRTVQFDSAFTFKYSRRPHTRAAARPDSVSETEKARRLAAVIELQERISAQRNQAWVGQVCQVLVEGAARRGDGLLMGKTPQFKTAVFSTPSQIAPGTTVAVRIESATSHSLLGRALL